MAKKIIELSDPKLRSLLSNQIENALGYLGGQLSSSRRKSLESVSYTHLRAHETRHDLV